LNITINKAIVGGTVKSIASKSQAHRLLICAALADSETVVSYAETSDDIEATAHCLAAIRRGDSDLNVRESGSTLRFMLPVCCALGIDATFHMSGRLPERPMTPLLDALREHGCTFSGVGSDCLKSSGQLSSGTFNLPGNISSQFISGLLLALPLLDGDSRINVEGREESGSYINMTIDALNIFGIEIGRGDGSYQVKSQQYQSPGKVIVEGDWSNAAFWLCAGAIGMGAVTCTNLNLNSSQGDMAVTRLLEAFGAEVTYGRDSVTVMPSREKLRGIRIDAEDTPDLVPVIAAVAAVAAGETVIYNAARLRIKESDRLRAVSETLSTLGADITETPDGLLIKGMESLKGGVVSSFGDHRIAMTAAVASCVCKEPVTINGAEAVDKSYPGFFRDFESLGGQVTEGG